MTGSKARAAYSEVISANVMAFGVPGFFHPRPAFAFSPFGMRPVDSVYVTSPLRRSLEQLVDFDDLNDRDPRLNVGAVDIETASFDYFDSADMRIEPAHIVASGALPPGFPPVEIDGRAYWDGGFVSNTPLRFVKENLSSPACIFQVDLFSAKGDRPHTLAEMQSREKDMQYSSRTRLTTDLCRELHALRLTGWQRACPTTSRTIPP